MLHNDLIMKQRGVLDTSVQTFPVTLIETVMTRVWSLSVHPSVVALTGMLRPVSQLLVVISAPHTDEWWPVLMELPPITACGNTSWREHLCGQTWNVSLNI